MDKKVKYNFLISTALFIITSVVFISYYYNTKEKLKEFHDVLEKKEKITFSMVVNTVLNDNKMGTFEENVKFANRVVKKDLIEIKDKMFIGQVNDIYLNRADYVNKNIKIEGIFKPEITACYVLRYGPGCCGSDGNVGFEVSWEGTHKPYPMDGDWVEAIGILKEDDYNRIYVSLVQLTVLNNRGNEYVSQ